MIPVSIERNVMDINKTLYRVSKEIIETDIELKGYLVILKALTTLMI